MIGHLKTNGYRRKTEFFCNHFMHSVKFNKEIAMKNISFEISGIMLEGKAKAMHPNDQGFYEDVPLLVLGKPSRNGKIYTVLLLIKSYFLYVIARQCAHCRGNLKRAEDY